MVGPDWKRGVLGSRYLFSFNPDICFIRSRVAANRSRNIVKSRAPETMIYMI